MNKNKLSSTHDHNICNTDYKIAHHLNSEHNTINKKKIGKRRRTVTKFIVTNIPGCWRRKETSQDQLKFTSFVATILKKPKKFNTN